MNSNRYWLALMPSKVKKKLDYRAVSAVKRSNFLENNKNQLICRNFQATAFVQDWSVDSNQIGTGIPSQSVPCWKCIWSQWCGEIL